MEKTFIILFLAGILFSCSKDREREAGFDLIGKWKLTEMLLDPGDGSGTFYPVSSDKIIEFHVDGTVTSNGSICNISTESGNPSEATYSLTDSTIHSSDCPIFPNVIRFTKKGCVLILKYPCDEPCQAKLIKEM